MFKIIPLNSGSSDALEAIQNDNDVDDVNVFTTDAANNKYLLVNLATKSTDVKFRILTVNAALPDAFNAIEQEGFDVLKVEVLGADSDNRYLKLQVAPAASGSNNVPESGSFRAPNKK